MPNLPSPRTRNNRLPLSINSALVPKTTSTVSTAAAASAVRVSSPGAMTSPISSAATLNILPSNQAAVISSPTSAPTHAIPVFGPPNGRPALSARTSSTSLHHDANSAGPIRHPRPMTAAQLHSELEQENEAVVNRLTRELSLLRAAQNASVVSNASSTSNHADTAPDHHHPLASPVYPIPIAAASAANRRHARTASNTSIRSTAAATISSSYEARRGIPLSRQGSSASRRSRTDSPGPHGFTGVPADSTLGYLQQQRIPAPTSIPLMSAAGSLPDATSPSLIAATPRYEETAFYRAELESAKRENDALKRRIRELERLVRDRRPSDSHSIPPVRPRSESVSTTASINPTVGSGAGIAPPRDSISGIAAAHHAAHAQGHVPPPVQTGLMSGNNTQPPTPSRPSAERAGSVAGSIAVGVPEEEVKVGESAANAGISAAMSPTSVGPVKE